ncbi:hypothetical protein C2S52_017017 [Perilla frutescens var. hirtella]|nr:hypothetical protein C2S52_017017 [Perilla frutescens var. hirtella]
MGFHTNCGEESYDKKTSKVNIGSSPQPKQREKLGSILNFEEYEDDSHPRAVNDAEKSKGFHQKQRAERKFCKSEEVVRYMSCLPSYLEKGETTPLEKPFSLGVLDWRQLEKWQHNNADVFGISADHSPSTSSTTSFISSKVSSSRLSSDNTFPHHHRKSNRPSTSTEERSSDTKLPAGNGGEFPKRRNDSINHLRVQHELLQATQSSNLDSVNRRKDGKSLDPSLQKVSGIRSQSSETDDNLSGLKGNGAPQIGKASKAKEQVPSSAITDLDFSERCKTTVPMSTNDPGHQHFPACHQSGSSEGDQNRLLVEKRNIFYGGDHGKVCHTNSRSENNRIYSIVSEHGRTRDSQVEKSFSKEIRSLNCSSGIEQTIPFTQSVSVSPTRRKNLEKKNSVSKPRNFTEGEILQMKVDSSESTKVRNPSPTRRFSFGMGRIGKGSNSKSSDIPKQVLETLPDSKVTSTSACSNNSTGGKSNATSRSRSSPLRRLLDPLLKPKGGVESRDFARSSERNPSAKGRSLKLSSGQIESPVLLSVKETVSLKGLKRDDISRPHYTQKNGISSMQALLQVAVKNGLPLFTFTVDNCRDILAATVKELGTKENMDGWIYTFLSFSEMKKKHAQWINQGNKDRNHGFVSNIIAQMKVSDIPDVDLTGKGYNKSGRREFVLSAVSSREANQTAGTLPCDGLAAVVVKYPRGDIEGIESVSEDTISTTVILPGGHHGVPSKGEPSSLIKRWQTGGSCDCGGWDLGCQLRILAGSNQSSQRLNSIKSQSTPLKLFPQDETEWPMFILSPFEDGIFSVEFDSSLKLIQAFSIAIAVVQSRTSVFPSSSMSGEIAASENMVSKIFNKAPVEVTAKYASYPPLSPVGRV